MLGRCRASPRGMTASLGSDLPSGRGGRQEGRNAGCPARAGGVGDAAELGPREGAAILLGWQGEERR